MLRIALAVLIALTGTAMAERPVVTPANEHLYKDSPTIELVTMGIGSLIWERHGHIALCVYYNEKRHDCYNYGVGDFQHPGKMGWGFFRGTNSFWVGKASFHEMLWIYQHFDRTIWIQPLPLTAEQKTQVIAKLEHDILDENKYYAYDHFWDNCTTRVRDIIDTATGGQLKEVANTPTDGKTFRDLARDGFYPMRTALLITDIAMGRTTDRVPTYWERMFLPQYLREAVVKRWGIEPTVYYQRKGDTTIASPKVCSDGSVVGQTDPCTPETPSGRVLFALLILALTSPAWATRLLGRFQRLGIAVAVVPPALFGLIFWFLAVISPLPYIRWNETMLILMPFDFLLLFLPQPKRVMYAKARVVMLACIIVLMLVGVLRQPITFLALWPLIPAAVVGFWPPKK